MRNKKPLEKRRERGEEKGSLSEREDGTMAPHDLKHLPLGDP